MNRIDHRRARLLPTIFLALAASVLASCTDAPSDDSPDTAVDPTTAARMPSENLLSAAGPSNSDTAETQETERPIAAPANRQEATREDVQQNPGSTPDPEVRPVRTSRSNSTVRANTDDWPRFRGPDGSGVSAEAGLPLKWNATTNIVWRTKLPGPGASSPITFGDHVYVTCYSGYGTTPEAPGDPANLQRHLVCLDREDGRILWNETVPSQVAEQPFTDSMLKHGYASSTPAADEDGVYVFFGASGAAAYTHEGRRKWLSSCGTNVHNYGSASSPIVVDDLLIVDASVESPGYPGSSGLYALDKRTGEVVWTKNGIGGGGYLTPTLVETNGTRRLVVGMPWGHDLAAAALESGELVWRCNVPVYTPTPVLDDEGVLYVLSKSGYAAVRTGGSGDVTETHKLWHVNSPIYRQASPLYWEGHLYWIPMDGGVACCANAKTGELVYRERIEPQTGPVYASPVLADGRIYYTTRKNGTFVLPARPEFEVLAHNVIETDDSVFNGSPAVGSGRIHLRSDGFLYAIGTNSP